MNKKKKKEISKEFKELLEYKAVFLEKLSPELLLDRRENNHKIKVVLEARLVKRNYY
jgi:hypothetical protein